MSARRVLGAIVRRETGGFFHSAMAPVLAGGFTLLVGVLFLNGVLGYADLSRAAVESGRLLREALNPADGVIGPVLSQVLLLLALLLPAVTMRLLAEEARSGRLDLLLSYPVGDHWWIAGKFLGALAVAGILLLALAPHLALVALLAGLEAAPLAAALGGLLLAAALAAAWGLLFSALTRHQLVAYLLAAALLLLLVQAGNLAVHLPPALAAPVGYLSLPEHFRRLAAGVVDVRDLVYFLGGAATGLLAANAALTGRRYGGGRAAARWTPALLMLGLTAVLAGIAARAPLAWDLTPDRRNSLAPQTRQILDALDRDVTVTAFYQRQDPRRRVAARLLAALSDASPRVHVEMLDPDLAPAAVQALDVTVARTVVVQCGERRRDLLDPDEAALASALFRVTAGEMPVIYWLQGHGERSLHDEKRPGFSACRAALERQGYMVRPLSLAERPAVPGDAAVLVVASPTAELLPVETEALTRYLEDGGGVLVLADPGTPASLEQWLRRYNIAPGGDFLVAADGLPRRFGVDPQVPVVLDYGAHPITHGLDGLPTFFPYAQDLRPVSGRVAGITARTLARLGERSWAESDLASVSRRRPRYDEGEDRPGPFSLAVAEEIDLPVFLRRRPGSADSSLARTSAAGLAPSVLRREETARLVVVGDADFASNAYLNLYGDRDLMLNMIAWLAREQPLVSRRAPAGRGRPLLLTAPVRRWLAWGDLAVWPLLVTGLAVTAVVRRRRAA